MYAIVITNEALVVCAHTLNPHIYFQVSPHYSDFLTLSGTANQHSKPLQPREWSAQPTGSAQLYRRVPWPQQRTSNLQIILPSLQHALVLSF